MDRETCDYCGAARDASDLAMISSSAFQPASPWVSDQHYCHGITDLSPTCYEIAARRAVKPRYVRGFDMWDSIQGSMERAFRDSLDPDASVSGCLGG